MDHTKYGNITFFCTAVTMPGVTLNATQIHHTGANGKLPGDEATYEDLTIRFIVDEDMNNYMEIFNWITDNVTGTEPTYCDVTLSILNSHKNVIKEFQFISAWPMSIGSIDFDAQNTEIENVLVDAVFAYDRFVAV